MKAKLEQATDMLWLLIQNLQELDFKFASAIHDDMNNILESKQSIKTKLEKVDKLYFDTLQEWFTHITPPPF